MVVYKQDSFTGSDGDPWSTSIWTIGSNTTGASSSIQSNEGRLGTGTSASGRVSRRFNDSQRSDVEISGTFRFGTGVYYPQLFVRCDSNVDTERGYGFLLNQGANTISLVRIPSGYSGSVVDTDSYSMSTGINYKVKLRAIGGEVSAKIWVATDAEPGTWNLTYTDGSPLAANYSGVTMANGAAVNSYGFLDDWSLTSGDNSIALTGSSTASGALAKSAAKNLVGSSTATGALVLLKVVERIFTGTVTAASDLLKSTKKLFAGSATPSGVASKTANRTYAGSVTPIGAYRNAFVRVFTGTVTAAGDFALTTLGRIFGRPGIVTTIAKAAGEISMRIRRT